MILLHTVLAPILTHLWVKYNMLLDTPLGTNNGGLDWNIVHKMILKELENIDCDIHIYEPSGEIIDRLKKERVKLTPERAMLLDVFYDMKSYGEFASVFAAEKIVYFLQRFGAEDIFKIKFERNIYGPYSGGKIAHVLYYLNGSYIKGMGSIEVKPFDNIWLMGDAYEDISSFLNQPKYESCCSILANTKDFLRGFYSNFSLELLSTVDFVIKSNERFLNWKDMTNKEVETSAKVFGKTELIRRHVSSL